LSVNFKQAHGKKDQETMNRLLQEFSPQHGSEKVVATSIELNEIVCDVVCECWG
jgi:hypothetical protein